MAVTVKVNGQISRNMRSQVRSALLRSAVLCHTRAVVLLSKPASRTTVRRTRTTSGGKAGSTYTRYTPSQPGQPPALRTGFGKSSVTWWEYKDNAVRVGVRRNGLYMAMLELGTRTIRARPWLSVALRDTTPAIRVLIQSAMRGA